MKKLFNNDLRLVKILMMLVFITGLSGIGYGATFTVTKTADTNDNICDADCSLREAIAAANSSSTNDSIIFSSIFTSAQTITLSGSQLIITNNGTLDITGPNANLLTISGNRSSRVFLISSGAITTFNNLRIIQGNGENGDAGGGIAVGGQLTVNNSTIEDNGPYSAGLTNDGGGVYVDSSGLFNLNNSTVQNNSVRIGGAGISSFGNVSITNSIIRNNTANDNGGGIRAVGTMSITNSLISNNRVNLIGNGGGGGIYNIGGSSVMTVSNSTISGNTSRDNGGGITNRLGATLTVSNSTISGNTSLPDTGGNGGGGIYNNGGLVVLNNSTVNDNTTVITSLDGGGGGIYNNSSNTIRLTNVTVSNNRATNGRGGGIYNNGGTGELTNVTVAYNESTYSSNNQPGGGGIFNKFDFAAVNVKNSIIADNRDLSGIAPDFGGTLISQGYNLIGNTAGTIISGTTTGNIFGQDPQLIPLRNNGGATQTVALFPTSPAIDAADPNNLPETDQRGIARPQDGDLNGSLLPDIGAYERQVSAVFVVTKTSDTNDASCNADCSLREAIQGINASSASDKAVVFDANLFSTAQTITLTLGELELNNVNGTSFIKGTNANLLTINGNNASRVFFINNQTYAAIENLTAAGGFVTNDLRGGGGILNNGRLTIRNLIIKGNTVQTDGAGFFNNGVASAMIFNSVIKDNVASAQGGGIVNFMGGNVTVSQSTISGNRATNNGGGISNGGNLSLVNSTVSGNTSNRNGGGIYQINFDGGLILTGSTITNNAAQQSGGGVFQASSVQARNTIIAGNTSGEANSGPDFDGTLFSRGYNLIGNTARTSFNGDTIGNILNVNPQLLPLGNYGGAIPTHALRSNSPAIDKGNSFGSTTDQRGQTRPYDFPGVTNASGGNGSDIGAFERQAADVGGSTRFDFDGDGRSDVSVFRPSNGNWYLQQSQNGFAGVSFGQNGDVIVPADYDGDGKTDVAVFRAGTWYLQRSQLGFTGVAFGAADDIPVPADYDGDGKTDVAVFRLSTGVWYLLQSTAGFVGITFGQNGDKPVAADYDGDGKADIAVNRGGTWYIQRSSLGFTGISFGDGNDKSVPADYDGDGKADVAVFRPSTGVWYLLQSTAGFVGVTFGQAGDLPVAADYDGDGRADVAVYRAGTWYLNRSTAGFMGVAFGVATDKPVPNAFVP